MTQPRAELFAAVLNTHTGEVVRRALQSSYEKSLKLTDSQIVLHWISNDVIVLKQWVRNRVIEIRRFTSPSTWQYINTKEMLADIGTRKGASLADVDQNSKWINGAGWMHHNESSFPTQTVSNVILTNSEIQQMRLESPSFNEDVIKLKANTFTTVFKDQFPSEEIQQRYSFSQYIIDPNKFSFNKVVRILAIVFKFLKCLKHLVKFRKTNNTAFIDHQRKKPSIILSDKEIKEAEMYFFKKGTLEVKKFQ